MRESDQKTTEHSTVQQIPQLTKYPFIQRTTPVTQNKQW